MYLPDYVYSIFKNSDLYIKNQKSALIKREDILLNYKEKELEISTLNPFLIFSIISLIGLFFTYKDFKNNNVTKWVDFTLLFSTGFIGIVVLFLWFFTDHSTTPNNFNFLWAFAPNLFVSFLVFKKNKTIKLKMYFKFLTLLMLTIPILWFLEVQLFPISISPFLILLLVRYLFLSKELK